MRYCLHIKNARLFDPARGIDRAGDLLTNGSKTIEYSPKRAALATETIDAEGCLAVPGLIDFHTHCARFMADNSVSPDLAMLPHCVTSAVDMGSAGTSSAEALIRHIIPASEMTLKCFVHAAALGVAAGGYRENSDPARYDADRMAYLFERYPDILLGVKLRLGKTFSDGRGTAPLDAAKRIAAAAGRPLCLHLTEPELPHAEFLSRLSAGDILCHCYQNQGGKSILGADGRVAATVLEARERGVLFDSAFAEFNHDFTVMQAAFARGFYPDLVSTDMVAECAYNRKTHSLPYVLSKHLALGMPLDRAITAVTATPARLMGMEGRLGTLAPGADADIALLELREGPVDFEDGFGNRVSGTRLLCPKAAVKAGRVAFKQYGFGLL